MQVLSEAGGETYWHLGGEVCAMEYRIPKGVSLLGHEHSYDHLSLVHRGLVRVTVGEESSLYAAGDMILIKAGKVHAVECLEDTVWFCIHHTTETEPEKIEKSVISENSPFPV